MHLPLQLWACGVSLGLDQSRLYHQFDETHQIVSLKRSNASLSVAARNAHSVPSTLLACIRTPELKRPRPNIKAASTKGCCAKIASVTYGVNY